MKKRMTILFRTGFPKAIRDQLSGLEMTFTFLLPFLHTHHSQFCCCKLQHHLTYDNAGFEDARSAETITECEDVEVENDVIGVA